MSFTLLMLLIIMWLLSIASLVLAITGFIYSPAYPFLFKCLWKGHKPFVSETDARYSHVDCEDCTKPLGAFSHDIPLEEWMKMGAEPTTNIYS